MFKALLIVGILVLAWCPWVTKEEARILVYQKVAEVKRTNSNLCEMTIDQNSLRKVPFGYTQKVAYDCSKSDSIYGVLKSTNVVFVDFYSGVWGVPKVRVNPTP